MLNVQNAVAVLLYRSLDGHRCLPLDRLGRIALFFLQPEIIDADLIRQRVVNAVMHQLKAGILLHDDMVHDLGFLLGRLLVFLTHATERADVFTADENLNEVRQRRQHRVGYVRAHRLGAVWHRRQVAHLALQVLHSPDAIGNDFIAHLDADGVLLLGTDDL